LNLRFERERDDASSIAERQRGSVGRQRFDAQGFSKRRLAVAALRDTAFT